MSPRAMKPLLSLLMFALLATCCVRAARAQFSDGFGGSLDPGLAASLYASDEQQGFSFAFDQSTSSFANPSYHTGISDPLRSYEIDSGISSKYDPISVSELYAAPFAFALTTSDSTLGLNDQSRGQHSLRFNAGVLNQLGRGGSLGPQSAQQMNGANAMRAAFTQGASTSAAFNGNPFSTETAAAIGAPSSGAQDMTAGAGVAPGAQTLAGITPGVQNLAGGSSFASVSGVSTADLELGDAIQPPSVDAANFYGTTVGASQLISAGDGELPLNDETMGRMSVAPPRALTYTSSGSGFTDSTRGNAALPSDALLSASPFSSPMSAAGVSPFAPVSEGTVFGVHESVSPNLHALPMLATPPSFRSFERHLQQERIASGDRSLDVATQSTQDRLEYKHMYGHRQNTLHDTMPDAEGGAQSGMYGSGGNAPIR